MNARLLALLTASAFAFAPGAGRADPGPPAAGGAPLAIVEAGEFAGGASEGFIEPAGLVVDPLGHVWTSDASANRLVRWDAEGRRIDEIGALGSDDNQFRRPTSLARLGSLGVAVLDVENRRIVAYDLLGRRTSLTISLDDPALESTLGRVTAVALAADRGGALWIADSERDRVLVYDFAGTYLRALGGFGTAPGTFHGLVALATTPHGDLLTLERALSPPRRKRGAPADTAAALPPRAQLLDASGAPIAAWPVGGGTDVPVAIAEDDSGRVAVALTTGERGSVIVCTRSGAVLGRRDDFGAPRALAFAPDGTLLVAEAAPARVRRFRLQPAAAGQ